MKWLLPVILAFALSAIGTQAQAQSRYDICAAYARDAMTGFYANSAVPVTMAERTWGQDRGYAYTRLIPGTHRAAPQATGSLQSYFAQCMAR
jgi:hypothetical protein